MDYFTNSAVGGPDSLSLQEMLDMDVKSDNDYENVFNCGGDLNLNFHELPALNLDEDSLGAPGDNNVWLASEGNSLLDGDVSNSFSQDMTSGETRMVSPNSVMPVTLIHVPYDKNVVRQPENSLLKPLTMKVSNSFGQRIPVEVKKEIKEEVVQLEIKQEYESDNDSYEEAYARAVAYKNIQNTRTKGRTNGRVSHSNKRTVPLKSVQSKRRHQDIYDSDCFSSMYPKPAYSYSCLIAMALKNSPSGCLPVSEIYNFMCEHFPYFKTAPNGWKNSVRHNLSLNKCFEKIEKPATNGSQRKGCLWAMNPSKTHKMDEEVQKWSKKDKTAIRRSMVCPESLDALERGELSTGGSGRLPVSEGESDEEVWEQEGPAAWEYKQETEDEEEEEDDKAWTNERLIEAAPDDLDDSDISLTDFDIEVAESLCKDTEMGKLNVRVNVQTSPNGTFQPLMAGSYTVSAQGIADNSPKRIKTLGGTTMTGNFVYKPVGSSTITKTKSPLRHSLLSSLEADD